MANLYAEKHIELPFYATISPEAFRTLPKGGDGLLLCEVVFDEALGFLLYVFHNFLALFALEEFFGFAYCLLHILVVHKVRSLIFQIFKHNSKF